MNVAVIYQLSDPTCNPAIMHELTKLGYLSSWSCTTNNATDIYELPEYMMWKYDGDLKGALKDMRTAVSNHNESNEKKTDLVKCITLNTAMYEGIKKPKIKEPAQSTIDLSGNFAVWCFKNKWEYLTDVDYWKKEGNEVLYLTDDLMKVYLKG